MAFLPQEAQIVILEISSYESHHFKGSFEHDLNFFKGNIVALD
jgi:hypothetical protein